MSAATALTALRDAVYARPSIRPGCAREHDETWDLVAPNGYSLREIESGHWHVVAGPGMCGWYCTGDDGMTWDDVVAYFAAGGAS